MQYSVLALNGYVAGIVVGRILEIESGQDTAVSGDQRIVGDWPIHRWTFDAGGSPGLAASVPLDAATLAGLDGLFEFGLCQH